MPDLPTITVTQPQSDKALAAYGSVANYKQWLRKAVTQYVLDETERIRDAADVTAKNALLAATKAELP